MQSQAGLFSELLPTTRHIWSKSSAENSVGHNLLAHLMDVAAVTETLLELEPAGNLAWGNDAFGLPRASGRRWLAALVGLHDFGKATPGFAAKWPTGREAIEAAGLEFPNVACRQGNHSLATKALLGQPLHALTGADKPWVDAVVQAISAHHGRHFLASENGKPTGEPSAWAQARKQILHAYWRVLAPAGEPRPVEPDLVAVNWLAGLTSVADWIASNPEWFPLGERYDDLGTYYKDAQRLAAGALHAAGWKAAQPLVKQIAETEALLTRIRGEHTPPRPLQKTGDDLLRSAQGPSLLLVEAPMGEGKTELAYLAHLRLQAANNHRGLYVALPTQATGNALFQRTLRFLEAFVETRTDIQLVHGGAAMNEDVRHLRKVGDSAEETLSASAWFSQRRRPLLSQYGVGTVDQALLATLNVKHHFVRLWGLANRVVVLDEVHAYDTYTGSLIVALVRWLKAMGSSVVLMSATLPGQTRDELISAWGASPDDVPDRAYPRVTLVDNEQPRSEHVPARPLEAIECRGLDENLDAIAEQATALVQEGGCGAIIVNTVDRAQTLYTMLAAARADSNCADVDNDLQLVLFHARFPADERGERESEVLELFGASEAARPRAALLIATQVAEQSLDLDFDFMLSDLAPVDLILQRAGRMHRHQRQRPARHDRPRLWVAGLVRDRLPSLKETAWGYVYDPHVLGRTWAFLCDEPVLNLPDDIDRLVQTIYGDTELPDNIGETERAFIEEESWGEYLGTEQAMRQQAVNISIDIEAEPQNAYAGKPFGNDDEMGMRNQTRLGPESVSVVPLAVTDEGWQIGDTVFDPDRVPEDAVAQQLYRRQLRLSRKAVVVHCQQSEQPVAFAEHPILKHLYPLPLKDGYGDMGGQAIRLDPELGLVYFDKK